MGRHWRIAAVMISRQIPQAFGTLGRENSDRERGLQTYRRRQHLAPHPKEVCDGKRTTVAPDETANDLRLTGWLERWLVAALLGRRDQRDDLRPFDQQVLQAVIDVVETLAQALEVGGSGRHRFGRCGGRRTSRVPTG